MIDRSDIGTDCGCSLCCTLDVACNLAGRCPLLFNCSGYCGGCFIEEVHPGLDIPEGVDHLTADRLYVCNLGLDPLR